MNENVYLCEIQYIILINLIIYFDDYIIYTIIHTSYKTFFARNKQFSSFFRIYVKHKLFHYPQ